MHNYNWQFLQFYVLGHFLCFVFHKGYTFC